MNRVFSFFVILVMFQPSIFLIRFHHVDSTTHSILVAIVTSVFEYYYSIIHFVSLLAYIFLYIHIYLHLIHHNLYTRIMMYDMHISICNNTLIISQDILVTTLDYNSLVVTTM